MAVFLFFYSRYVNVYCVTLHDLEKFLNDDHDDTIFHPKLPNKIFCTISQIKWHLVIICKIFEVMESYTIILPSIVLHAVKLDNFWKTTTVNWCNDWECFWDAHEQNTMTTCRKKCISVWMLVKLLKTVVKNVRMKKRNTRT